MRAPSSFFRNADESVAEGYIVGHGVRGEGRIVPSAHLRGIPHELADFVQAKSGLCKLAAESVAVCRQPQGKPWAPLGARRAPEKLSGSKRQPLALVKNQSPRDGRGV